MRPILQSRNHALLYTALAFHSLILVLSHAPDALERVQSQLDVRGIPKGNCLKRLLLSLSQPLLRNMVSFRQARHCAGSLPSSSSNMYQPRRGIRRHGSRCMAATSDDLQHERDVEFSIGSLFYRPTSRLIRDLGALALAVLYEEKLRPLRVLDAMSGTGVRSLRYAREGKDTFVHSNELQFGDHPLRSNLATLIGKGNAVVTNENAVDVYMRARLNDRRYDFVDCDAFGTGMPHTAEAWWAVEKEGLLYLCATDSLTTDGRNPHKAMQGYAGVAASIPASNEVGLRMLLGAAWREAAARNLHAEPIFSYFHAPSSSFRVMLRLKKAKRPPALEYQSLAHVIWCSNSSEAFSVRSHHLGDYVGEVAKRLCSSASVAAEYDCHVLGPMWVGPMHNAGFVDQMIGKAAERCWDDAASLLKLMREETLAEIGGSLLFYHLGDVQRRLVTEGLDMPKLKDLVQLLQKAGFTASHSHIEKKAIKTSASMKDLVEVVRSAALQI